MNPESRDPAEEFLLYLPPALPGLFSDSLALHRAGRCGSLGALFRLPDRCTSCPVTHGGAHSPWGVEWHTAELLTPACPVADGASGSRGRSEEGSFFPFLMDSLFLKLSRKQ